jgi:hypothetical protein
MKRILLLQILTDIFRWFLKQKYPELEYSWTDRHFEWPLKRNRGLSLSAI